jgi:hypothetical protein
MNRLKFRDSYRSKATGKPEAIAVFSQVAFDLVSKKSERSSNIVGSNSSMLITGKVARRYPLFHFVAACLKSRSELSLVSDSGVVDRDSTLSRQIWIQLHEFVADWMTTQPMVCQQIFVGSRRKEWHLVAPDAK